MDLDLSPGEFLHLLLFGGFGGSDLSPGEFFFLILYFTLLFYTFFILSWGPNPI